jgi:hypothetical protein
LDKTKKSEADIFEAVLLLSLIDSLAISILETDEATLNKMEKSIIQPALQRTLERLPQGAQEAMSKYTDPAIIILGLGSYFYRISKLLQEKQERDKAIKKLEEASMPVKSAQPKPSPTKNGKALEIPKGEVYSGDL